MIKRVNLRLDPAAAADGERCRREAARIMGVDIKRLVRTDLIKRSIDARQRRIAVHN